MLEKDLANTFAIAFSKKNRLKEAIYSTTLDILRLEAEEKDLQQSIKKAKEHKETEIQELDDNINRIEREIVILEKRIEAGPSRIVAAKKKREDKELVLRKAQQEAENFHVDYLIKEHEDILTGLSEQIKVKERRMEKIKKEISKFEKDLEKLEEKKR